MTTAFSHILSKESKHTDPIMAAHKISAKKLNAEQVAKKEEKLKQLKKMERMYREYVVPTETTNEYEKELRMVATKGVIKLFNAVKAHQKQLQKPKKSSTEETSGNLMKHLENA
eukprot:TRINITY_DN3088_c0_g2_i2.p1 TRINITY_DN3088_c0_g2~~TRINITY_DN3088_c0_g2_i2.p1  ORF type:complete len:114 (-),score=34.66 TRINITY_DN3088_c0_g2_i2:63-404(-)